MSIKKVEEGWKRTAIDLISGTVGGVSQAIVGHPLETIKARLQQQTGNALFKGPLDCAVSTFRNEGITGFYKGLSPPLVTAGLMNAVIFTTNGFMKRLVHPDTSTPLTMPEIILASELTAPIYVSFLCPVELLKVKLQVQSSKAVKLYSGPIDCIRKVLQQDGALGFYRGFLPTLCTRLVGLPFYFGGYEFSKKMLIEYCCDNSEANSIDFEPPPWLLLTAGGLGGIAFWSANFPFDLLKTKIQAGAKGGMVEVGRKLLASEGVPALYRGFAPCILRAFPANAVAFTGYELTCRFLSS